MPYESMGSHKMETPVQSTQKRLRRRRKKARSGDSELKSVKRDSKSPSLNLAIKNVGIAKRKAQDVTVTQHLDCVIKDICEQQVSQKLFAQNREEKDCVECRQPKGDVFEKTVDLCEDDSFVGDPNSSLIVLQSFEVEQKNVAVIDLSKDLTEHNEVIDLTEPYGKSQSNCVSDHAVEPAVIDISEEESKDKSNLRPENDDIFVIGTFSKSSDVNSKYGIPLIQLSNQWSNFNNIINCSHKFKKKYLKKQSILGKIDSKNGIQCRKKHEKGRKMLNSSKVAKIGENIYVNSPMALPSCGLRPIIIDGSNVAFVHSNSNFCCKRLEICINYFKEKGHKVTAFVPQYRLGSNKSDDPQLLRKLERQGDVILTPSKKIDGRNIVPYDDRFIVQTAVLKGGIIVTRDNYNDLLKENPAWAETIKYRTLAFTWVDDVLMFPKDPLGEYGPSLEEFLKFH